MFRRIAVVIIIITSLVVTNVMTARFAQTASQIDAPRWDYAMLLYATKDSEVVVVMTDDDERKELSEFFGSFREALGVDEVPALYYLGIMGRYYGWELVTVQYDNSGQIYTLKRPYND